MKRLPLILALVAAGFLMALALTNAPRGLQYLCGFAFGWLATSLLRAPTRE